jgi:hypothetical protein
MHAFITQSGTLAWGHAHMSNPMLSELCPTRHAHCLPGAEYRQAGRAHIAHINDPSVAEARSLEVPALCARLPQHFASVQRTSVHHKQQLQHAIGCVASIVHAISQICCLHELCQSDLFFIAKTISDINDMKAQCAREHSEDFRSSKRLHVQHQSKVEGTQQCIFPGCTPARCKTW